jgi:hypothetical protein
LFQGSGMAELMMAHIEGTPDLSPLPAPEQQALLRALAKDPAKRYPSCREFISALESALARELGLSHVEQTYAEHRDGPASEMTGEKTDPNSILPSIGGPTLTGRAPLIARWRQSAQDKPASSPDRTPPDWKVGKKTETLSGKPRLFKSVAMFLVLIIAGIAIYGLFHDIIVPPKPQPKEPVDFLPANCERAEDAKIVTVGGKTYYDRMYVVLEDKTNIEFVLIPPMGNESDPYYLMADKVSVDLFRKYADSTANEVDETWKTIACNKKDGDRPVMGVSGRDAFFFAKSFGGKLPTYRQWDHASGMFRKDRAEWGPYQDCGKRWAVGYDHAFRVSHLLLNAADCRCCPAGIVPGAMIVDDRLIGVRRKQTEGPLRNREGLCDYVVVERFGRKIYDMAGNGREWTGMMLNGEPVDLAIERYQKKKLDSTDTVVTRGYGYLEFVPLRYEVYEVAYVKGGGNLDSHELMKGDIDIGFRVAIQP